MKALTWTMVRPGDRVWVEMPLRDALLVPSSVVKKTRKVAGVVTEEGNVDIGGGTILPMPGDYRLRRKVAVASPKDEALASLQASLTMPKARGMS